MGYVKIGRLQIMRQYFILLFLCCLSCSKSDDIYIPTKVVITPLDEYLVYEDGKHNAFTDICEYNGKFYLAFRNAYHHLVADINSYGKIVIMESSDGTKWDYLFAVSEGDCDLRDPKLVVDTFGYLNLYCGYSKLVESRLVFQGSKAGRIDIENRRTELLNIFKNRWLWTIVWYNNIAYSIAYDEDGVYFLKSVDGYNWEEIFEYKEVVCNEASLDFVNGQAMAILRTASGENTLIGHADFPYFNWVFTEIPQIIQSPKLLPLPNGDALLAGRMIEKRTNERFCGLFVLEDKVIADTIWLSNSAIDIAYPGACATKDNIYVSFYSGNWKSANIYVKKFSILLE